MTPCPESAMPVVEILRRDVLRPERLPTPIYPKTATVLRWKASREYDCLSEYCCPLGLLPNACIGEPGEAEGAGLDEGLETAVTDFFEWWDALTEADAAEAVEFLWPAK